MSKRKRPSRSSRSRISAPRPHPSGTTRHAATPHKDLSGRYWLHGVHAVYEALKNEKRTAHRLLLTRQAAENLTAALGDIAGLKPQPELADRAELDAACGPDSVHQGIALLVDPLEDIAIEDIRDQGMATVVMLDQATDPRNIGAVMRSARALGAGAVVVQDRNAPAETAVMAKAASGAMEHIPLVRVTNLARSLWTLKDAGYWTIGLDGAAETEISSIERGEKLLIVLGAEGKGLRRLTAETCDQLVKIDINPMAESLNLSNAAAIALYALRQRS